MSALDYFASRRTIRNYTNKHIPENLLKSIIEKAMRAPTCGNMQLYTVIATVDPEKKRKLTPAHFNQPAAVGADVILTVCADYNRFSRWCRLSNADPGYDNFLSFMSATADAMILAQQIATIAEMEGIGTCYLGTVTYNADQISEILELPELVVPVACLSLGYPADKGEPSERLPLEAVFHLEKYNYFSDEEIMNLYKAKDEFEPNAKYIAENNKTSLAQVYTDIRYPREMNENFSIKFMETLKQKGFYK